MDTAPDSTIRADRLSSLDIFSFDCSDYFLVGESTGRTRIYALSTERAGRFEQVVIEERSDRIILTATFNGNRTGLFPVITDIGTAKTRDAVVIITLDERVIIIRLLTCNQRWERVPLRSIFFGCCVQFAFLERYALRAVGWR